MGSPEQVSSMGVVVDPLKWTSDPPPEKPDQLVVKMLFDLCTPSLVSPPTSFMRFDFICVAVHFLCSELNSLL